MRVFSSVILSILLMSCGGEAPPPPQEMTAAERGLLALTDPGILSILLALAVPLAVAMFAKPSLEKALAPFLVASQAIPVFALAPLLVVWLGYGLASKILMAAVIIFFPITVSLLEGFRSCDTAYRILFRLMGAGFWQTLRRLYWPWALPYFFAGLRVGVSVATIGAVIGEVVEKPVRVLSWRLTLASGSVSSYGILSVCP